MSRLLHGALRNIGRAFGPLSLSGVPERWLFAAACVVGLVLVLGGDMVGRHHGTDGALSAIPVVAAAWLLSRRLTVAIAVVAVICRVIAVETDSIPVLTAVSQSFAIPVLAVLGRLAAEGVRAREGTAARLEQVSLEGRRTAALEQAKSEFLRLASHELRSPLAVLSGYVSMLQDGSLGELPESAAHAVPILAARLKSMSLMIDHMLETARLEDERLQLRLEDVELGDLVRRCRDDMEQLTGPQHTLEVRAPAQPVTVTADRLRVETIVNNLLDNAVKYSPAGGAVTCELAVAGEQARISVEDEGIGISPDERPRLFTRFTRLNPGTAIPGTGLGLYVSRELARKHGGDLTVESVPGKGSCFTLALPLRWTRAPGGPAPAAPPGRAERQLGLPDGKVPWRGERSRVHRRTGLA